MAQKNGQSGIVLLRVPIFYDPLTVVCFSWLVSFGKGFYLDEVSPYLIDVGLLSRMSWDQQIRNSKKIPLTAVETATRGMN